MVFIFTSEPDRLTVAGQNEPSDRPVIAPASWPAYQGVALRQHLEAYRERE